MAEKSNLLDNNSTPSTHSDSDSDDARRGKKKKKTKHYSGGKREKLSQNPSLMKVDEDIEKEKREESQFKNDYFGVKSYLHNFYDTHFFKDPDLYEAEEDEYGFLLPKHRHRRACTSVWWKVFVWIGANFLIFGIIGVLIGYLVPQRPLIVGSIADSDIDIVDRDAVSFNFNLDVCKLVGLILFCIGGLTLTVALLFPSLLYRYFDDDRRDRSFHINYGDYIQPPTSPTEKMVPTSSILSSVQPVRLRDESILTQEGMVTMAN